MCTAIRRDSVGFQSYKNVGRLNHLSVERSGVSKLWDIVGCKEYHVRWKPCDTGGRIIARKERENERAYLTVTTDQSLSFLAGCSRWTRVATITTTHTTGWPCMLKMKWRWRTRSQRRRRSNTRRRYGIIDQHLRLCFTCEITRPSDPWRRRSPRISVCAWQFFGWVWSCEWGWCCWCRCWGSGW